MNDLNFDIDAALEDEDWTVREQAIQHPNCTNEHINKALDDEHWSVKLWAIKHPNVTIEHINKALSDSDPHIREIAEKLFKELP